MGTGYVTKKAYETNLERQSSLAPETLAQLREIGVDAKTELRLEYFFYTDAEEKAQALAAALKKLGYDVDVVPAAANPEDFCVTGWTTKMTMAEEVVVAWTREMCDLGYKHDCEFDGWGTTPDQG